MPTKKDADAIAALEIKIEVALRDIIGRGATPSILVGRGRWEIAKAVAAALMSGDANAAT